MKIFFYALLIIFPTLTGFWGGGLYAQQDTSAKATAGKQGQALIDSLLQELPKQQEDTNKVNILNALSYNYHPINTDEGIKYGQQALELAIDLEWKPGIARANIVMGNNYLRKSDDPKALEYYQQSLKMYEELGNKKGIASATSNIGLLYLSESNQTKALEYFFKALKMHDEIGNKDGVAIACDNIADVYKNQNNYTKALEYYNRALKLNEEIGKKVGVALVTEGIGEIFVLQKNYSAAISYIQKSINIDEEIGDKLGIAWGLTNIGKAYLAVYNDTSAILMNDTDHCVNKEYLSSQAGKKNILDKAIDCFQQGIMKGEEIHALDVLQDCYKNLAGVYKLKMEYKQALEYYNDYNTIKDSVFSKENSEKMARMEYESICFSDSLKTAQVKKITDLKLRQQQVYTYSGVVIIALLLCFSFFIVKERGKSEKLLLNILPVKIAAELKSKGFAKTSYFDHVTVLFTDFQNFTKASERMTPQTLIDELHTCFKAFDEITGKHGIEKIKTIGDAYLAVCGLPVAYPKHAENIVRAALEINAFMQDRYAKLGDKTFEIRIGIHSGSVVAGIVGVKKFAYDIWGDTVNIAARMEQNSMPGKINISETTYELVKDKFTCEYWREIEAKNKGAMKMYFVV